MVGPRSPRRDPSRWGSESRSGPWPWRTFRLRSDQGSDRAAVRGMAFLFDPVAEQPVEAVGRARGRTRAVRLFHELDDSVIGPGEHDDLDRTALASQRLEALDREPRRRFAVCAGDDPE